MKNHAGLTLCGLCLVMLMGLFLRPLLVPAVAQTPASYPPLGYQPLSPTAVEVSINGGKPVPGNIVGQIATKYGERYVVETKRGQTVVSGAALLGLPSPALPPSSRRLPANVHRFR